MSLRHRSCIPPAILILAFTAGGTGCDTEARRLRWAEEARKAQALEDGQRRQAETQPPTQEVMDQVRSAVQAFLEEHHPQLAVEGTTFTPMTPNLFLVGAEVHDLLKGNRYVAQLTAERLRDVSWGEDGDAPHENGQLLWVVDYAEAGRMALLAQRHGFAPEVERIENWEEGRRSAWQHRSWLDNYLLWHFLFHRPSSYAYHAGSGYGPLPAGYRFQEPGRPITAEDARPFQGAAAATGGRSMVFLGGHAWRPPLVSSAPSLPGQAFVAGRGGSLSGKAPMGSVSRGGFGAAGHAAGIGG